MGLLVDTLATTDLLTGAGEEAVLRLMVLGKSRDLKRGHVFWRTQAAATALVIPVTGEAKSYSRNPDGRELIYRFVGPGEWAGLASCLDGLPHPTTLEVVRAGEFFSIARAAFTQFVAEFPTVQPRAIAALSRSFRRDLHDREDVALRSVGERIARFFIEHACLRQTDGAKILVNATQAELAARLGTVREVVARVIGRFVDRQLIDRVGRDLFIQDWRGLCAEAGFEEQTADNLQGALVSPQMRTCRFFLSSTDPRKRSISNSPEICRDHLGDLAACRDMGCPAAQAPEG